MEQLRYFFRAEEDGYIFKKFGLVHLCFFALWAFCILGIIVNSEKLKKDKKEKLLKTLAIILLIDQIILYTWMIATKRFDIYTNLPLYHCRISVWFLIIASLFNNKFFQKIGVYWGILGSIAAIMYPDLYKFSFPHYTNFQFFIMHFLLGIIPVYMIFVRDFSFNKKDVRQILYITNAFNILLIVVNILLKGANYGYLTYSPIDNIKFFEKRMTYLVTIFIMYNLAMCLVYFIGKGLNKIKEKKSIKGQEELEVKEKRWKKKVM